MDNVIVTRDTCRACGCDVWELGVSNELRLHRLIRYFKYSTQSGESERNWLSVSYAVREYPLYCIFGQKSAGGFV